MPYADPSAHNPLAVRLDADQRAWLKRERERTGASVNAQIRLAVMQYINRKEAARNRKETSGTATR